MKINKSRSLKLMLKLVSREECDLHYRFRRDQFQEFRKGVIVVIFSLLDDSFQGPVSRVSTILSAPYRDGGEPTGSPREGRQLSELAVAKGNLSPETGLSPASEQDHLDDLKEVSVLHRGIRVRGGKVIVTYTLYRIYDAGGELLYVGQTNDETSRVAEHVAKAAWLPVTYMVNVERGYRTRAEVEEAECAAIENEHPRFNIEGKTMPYRGWSKTVSASKKPTSTRRNVKRSASLPSALLPPFSRAGDKVNGTIVEVGSAQQAVDESGRPMEWIKGHAIYEFVLKVRTDCGRMVSLAVRQYSEGARLFSEAVKASGERELKVGARVTIALFDGESSLVARVIRYGPSVGVDQ